MISEMSVKKTYLPPETILPQNGLVDGFIKYSSEMSFRNFFRIWRQIRRLCKEGFSTVVYLTPSGRIQRQRLRDLLFFRLCGVKQFWAAKGFRENLQPRSPVGGLTSLPQEADALLARLKLNGLATPDLGQGCMDLRLTTDERAQAQAWWQKNIGKQRVLNGWVAICTGGKLTSKLWPWERYAEVGRWLIERHGLFPVVIGGPEDREIGQKLVTEWGMGLCAAGQLNVRERESAALMENARFYLGNDTGVMHLAAAVNIRCVAIFSSRDWPGIWEPYGKGHKVLRHDLPCSGCKLSVCNQKLECLTNISVEQVYEACVEVINQQV
jgi:heptosyltransferase-3